MDVHSSVKITGALLLSLGIAQGTNADTLKLKLGNEGTVSTLCDYRNGRHLERHGAGPGPCPL